MRKLATALEAGIPLEKAINLSGGALDGVVTDLLDLARVTGVKRSALIRIAADSLWNGNKLTREANIASSAARASAIVLSALPILASAGAALFGINVLVFLLGHFFGYLCLFVGLLSIWFGWGWMAKIRSKIVAPLETEGLLLNCAAEVVSSSAIYSETEKMLNKLAEKWGVEPELQAILEFRNDSRDTGTPFAGILREEANERRLEAEFRVRESIETLPAKLLAPLGVCLFPAFISLAVTPTVAGMATAAFGSHSG